MPVNFIQEGALPLAIRSKWTATASDPPTFATNWESLNVIESLPSRMQTMASWNGGPVLTTLMWLNEFEATVPFDTPPFRIPQFHALPEPCPGRPPTPLLI